MGVWQDISVRLFCEERRHWRVLSPCSSASLLVSFPDPQYARGSGNETTSHCVAPFLLYLAGLIQSLTTCMLWICSSHLSANQGLYLALCQGANELNGLTKVIYTMPSWRTCILLFCTMSWHVCLFLLQGECHYWFILTSCTTRSTSDKIGSIQFNSISYHTTTILRTWLVSCPDPAVVKTKLNDPFQVCSRVHYF